MKYPPTQASLEWGPLAIPAALLLIWLFNLYKLGKLSKRNYILSVAAAVIIVITVAVIYIKLK